MNNQITHNDIQFLIATLRTLYASQFNKSFPSEGQNVIPMSMVEAIVGNALTGVTKPQFDRGIVLLSTSGKKFMPSFADFKELCVGQDWWNAQKAWVKACEYTKIMKHKAVEIEKDVFQFQEITTIAKFALDQVMLLITDGEMHEAKRQFMKLYEEYLAEAQLKGRVQEWYQEPILLAHKNEQKVHKPVSNDEAQKHLNSLMGRLKINGRKPVPVQKLQAKDKEPEINQELGPDPFDNPHEYAEMCRREGMPIPRNIQQLIDGANA